MKTEQRNPKKVRWNPDSGLIRWHDQFLLSLVLVVYGCCHFSNVFEIFNVYLDIVHVISFIYKSMITNDIVAIEFFIDVDQTLTYYIYIHIFEITIYTFIFLRFPLLACGLHSLNSLFKI